MQPLVSVRVATYNHEKYLVQCLEGILMQRTDFPFEVVIGEDFSTDYTSQIVSAYQEKYPQQVRALLHTQNLGPARNSQQIQQACLGRYHAMCEGDDYWIDPLKLQKQVDWMEAHPEVTLCFHNALVLNENTKAARLFFENDLQSSFTFAEACNLTTPTASVMARSDALATLPEWRTQIWCGDVLFRLWCARQGSLGYLNEMMAVYRVHGCGAVAKAQAQLEKARDQEVFLYQQLDQETGGRYAGVLQAKVHQVKEKYRRQKNPRGYDLLHPNQMIIRLHEYWQAISKFRSVKHYGHLQQT